MARTTIPAELVAINAIQGTLIADNAITAVHIATNAVSGTLVADNAVTSTHIAQNNVTATQIAQNTITVTQMADDAIETAKINASAVTTAKINNGAVTADKLAANSVTSAKIVNGTIVAADLADNAVTIDKMASLTRGSIIYGDSAGDPAALSLGTTGKLLVSDGTDISWSSTINATTTFQANDSIRLGSYNAIGQTSSGAMGILGHNARVDGTAHNTVKAINSSWPASFIKLYYDQGMSFHVTSGNVTAGDTLLSGTGANTHERLRITNAGDVLIGQNSIASTLGDFAQLEVSHGTAGGIIINTQTAGSSNYGRLMFSKGNDQGNEGVIRYNTGDYHMGFFTNASEKMRILSTGQITTGGLTSTTAALHLYSDNSWSGILTLQSQAAANATAQIAFMSRDSSNVNDTGYIKYNNSGGSVTNQFDFYPSNQRTFSISSHGSTHYGDTGTNQGIGQFIGTIAPHNTGNRYIHVQLSTNYNQMAHIFVYGYSYTSALIEGGCAFYFYNNANQTTLYDFRRTGSIVAGHCNSSNNYAEIVIDTLGTATTNRWGNITIYGGQDNIVAYHHTEVVQVSYTNSTARAFT